MVSRATPVFLVNPEQTFEKVWPIVISEFWGEAPHPTLTGIGVTWLYGFDVEFNVRSRLQVLGRPVERPDGVVVFASRFRAVIAPEKTLNRMFERAVDVSLRRIGDDGREYRSPLRALGVASRAMSTVWVPVIARARIPLLLAIGVRIGHSCCWPAVCGDDATVEVASSTYQKPEESERTTLIAGTRTAKGCRQRT